MSEYVLPNAPTMLYRDYNLDYLNEIGSSLSTNGLPVYKMPRGNRTRFLLRNRFKLDVEFGIIYNDSFVEMSFPTVDEGYNSTSQSYYVKKDMTMDNSSLSSVESIEVKHRLSRFLTYCGGDCSSPSILTNFLSSGDSGQFYPFSYVKEFQKDLSGNGYVGFCIGGFSMEPLAIFQPYWGDGNGPDFPGIISCAWPNEGEWAIIFNCFVNCSFQVTTLQCEMYKDEYNNGYLLTPIGHKVYPEWYGDQYHISYGGYAQFRAVFHSVTNSQSSFGLAKHRLKKNTSTVFNFFSNERPEIFIDNDSPIGYLLEQLAMEYLDNIKIIVRAVDNELL